MFVRFHFSPEKRLKEAVKPAISKGGKFMMRHYIEPVGWLLVFLLFVALPSFAVVPAGKDSRQPARQLAFDVTVVEPSGK